MIHPGDLILCCPPLTSVLGPPGQAPSLQHLLLHLSRARFSKSARAAFFQLFAGTDFEPPGSPASATELNPNDPSLSEEQQQQQGLQQQKQLQLATMAAEQSGWLQGSPGPMPSADSLLKLRVPPVLESLVRSVEMGRQEGQLGSKLPVKMDPER